MKIEPISKNTAEISIEIPLIVKCIVNESEIAYFINHKKSILNKILKKSELEASGLLRNILDERIEPDET